jgi:hypothetical protein
MSFCIIVARYNENVEWTKYFPNVIIYNKGNKLDNNYNEVFLNNVGREGHTYYKYICDNYENLAEYTIFLQGNPFDHSPNIIYNLNNLINYINNNELSIDFEFLSEQVYYSSLDLECSRWLECRNIHKNWERVFGVNIENQECIFGAGAQFIVSKKKILKNTKEFYENIVKMLDYDINPLEGYDIERFHKYIFI